MPRHVYLHDSSSSEELCTPIRRPRHVRHPSVVSSHHHHHVHEPAYAAPNLAVPVVEVGGRQRAASTGGLPQPNIVINNTDGSSRSHSRERVRPRSRSRGRRIILDEDDFDEIVDNRRGRVSRSPSPYRHDFETRQAFEKLRAFERAKAEEEALKRYKTELEAKLAKEELERIQEEEHQKALKKKAVEDWQREEDLKRIKEKKEKEERDKLIEEGIIQELKDRDWSPERIEAFIKKKGDHHSHEHRVHVNEMRIAHSRPTYIRVHRKHLLPETLDAYDLPWEYDSENTDFILITEYINSEFQEQLFAHTRELKKIRSHKLIEGPIEKTTILKINDKKKDKMYLVRKKSSSGAGITILRS